MSRRTWMLVTVVGLAALAIGAAGGVWYVQRQAATAPAQTVLPPRLAAISAAPKAQEEIIVTIPPDALLRMNLSFAEVRTENARSEIRVPGTAQPDGYKQVAVTSVAGGIATEVAVELGQTVRRGQRMARLFSKELAEAQSVLAGFIAELEVEHKRFSRVQELVRLGAASREELEEVEAEHRLHQAHVEEARQRLLFLGLTAMQVDEVAAGHQVSSEIVVPAPIDGTVVARQLNLGQVVMPGQNLFTVTDLSSIWIEANLLENDFGAVRVGSRATVTTAAYPNRTYQGTVEYIDPQVDSQTRSAKVRVTVANTDLALRLGMYADVSFTSPSGARVPVIPPEAIQQVGPVSVVFIPIAGEENRFRQQAVTIGDEVLGGRQVLSGLASGERVVTTGSFLLRSESLRQYSQ